MSWQETTLVEIVADSDPRLRKLLHQHILDFSGELMPSLYVATVGDWVWQSLSEEGEVALASVGRTLDAVEAFLEAQRDDQTATEYIDLFFVEALPTMEEDAASHIILLKRVGPRLEELLMKPARP